MYKCIILVLIFATSAFAHSILRDWNRIIGGNLASPGQFPYQISQRFGDLHFCGGSIIAPDTILSAAHCTAIGTSNIPVEWITIVAGSNQLDQGGQSYEVSSYSVHDDYDSNSHINDIAVFKLKTSLTYTSYIKPIEVDSSVITAGTATVISGWGSTVHPGDPSNDLRYFHGKVVDFDQCKTEVADPKFPLTESHICSFASLGVGTCKGDSGGALVANNKHIGIISWSAQCAVGSPNVCTKTSHYTAWIQEHIDPNFK